MTVLLLIKQLCLEKRRPHQTRHTTATIWLAAGEASECSASHMTTLRLISSNSMISGAEIEQLTTLALTSLNIRPDFGLSMLMGYSRSLDNDQVIKSWIKDYLSSYPENRDFKSHVYPALIEYLADCEQGLGREDANKSPM